jgi:hypothetical protein
VLLLKIIYQYDISLIDGRDDTTGGNPMSDDQKTSPGAAHELAAYAHELAANDASMNGDNATAQVHAILALASAVSRLAAAQETTASEAVR